MPANTPHWKTRCYGPHKMKDAPPRRDYASKLPHHFRDFGVDSTGRGGVACGLTPGRTKGKYAGHGADVPWSRVSVDLRDTTCPHCLIAVIKRCKQKLRDRLKATGKTALTAFREQRQVAVVQGLKQLVNA